MSHRVNKYINDEVKKVNNLQLTTYIGGHMLKKN